MKITPHSPWYLRKQRLSSFKFTDKIKEVPSMVLNGHEVNEGIKLVKGLPDARGAIVKEYDSPYTSAIMAEMNSASLKLTVLSISEGQCLLGAAIGGNDLGSLHPAHVVYYENRPYLMIGTVPHQEGINLGYGCIIDVKNVTRVHQHKKIHYACQLEQVKEILPPIEPDYIGNVDVLVGSEQFIESEFNIGDYVINLETPNILGQILNMNDEEAIVIWEDGVIAEAELEDLSSDLSSFSKERLAQAQETIQSEKIRIMNLPVEEVME